MEKLIDKKHLNFKDRAGEKFITDENFTVTIIKYKSYHNCDISFDDGTILEKVSLLNLRRGKIIKPKSRVGEKYISNEGFEYEIIRHEGWNKYTILFNHKEVRENLCYWQIKKGKVKNYLFPQIYGVGYIGEGVYDTYSKVGNRLIYHSWLSMLKRCYDNNELLSRPTYIGCKVKEDWHNYQNFAKWFEENYEPEYMEGWELDKDTLIKGNKLYSFETCCFVPKEINTVFTKRQNKRGDTPIGVIRKSNRFQALICMDNIKVNLGSFLTSEEAFQAYKTAKEDYIKQLANKYRGRIIESCYQSLITYEVEITD